MASADILKHIARERVAGFMCGRFVKCKGLAEFDRPARPEALVDPHWMDAEKIKSAVSAIGSQNAGIQSVYADFMDVFLPLAILGRLGVDLATFRRPTLTLTGDKAAAWVEEGESVPLNGQTLARQPGLSTHFVSAVDVATKEALLGPSQLDQFILRNLASKVATALDVAFINPANDGNAKAPAAINAPSSFLPSVAAIGNAQSDVDALFALFQGDWLAARIIMNPLLAVQLGGAFGSSSDTNLGALGGKLAGVPVITSRSVPYDSSGSPVTIVDVSALAVSLEVSDLSVTTEATLVMDDTPAMNSTTPTGVNTGSQALVSLWQTNSVGFMASAKADWQARRDGAVAVLANAAYGASS